MTFDEWCESLTAEQRYDFDSEGRAYKKDSSVVLRLAWDAATHECKKTLLAVAKGYDLVPGQQWSKEFQTAHGVLVGVAAALERTR